MPDILFQEFRDQFEPTRYPFMDTSSLLANTGQQLDLDMFLDATLYPIGSVGGYVYLSNINIEPRAVTLSIADKSRKAKATAVFDPLAGPDVVYFADTWDRPAGVMISDATRLARFTSWPEGDHGFAPANSTFVPSCVIPTPEIGVRGVLTADNDLFTGDLMVIGDNGVVVRQDGPGVIRVDIVGDPLFRRKLCTPVNLFKPPGFIKTINGCPPDKYGNFNLTVGDHLNGETIVRIYKSDQGLIIEAVGTTTQVN